jgi:hypothetical protein
MMAIQELGVGDAFVAEYANLDNAGGDVMVRQLPKQVKRQEKRSDLPIVIIVSGDGRNELRRLRKPSRDEIRSAIESTYEKAAVLV